MYSASQANTKDKAQLKRRPYHPATETRAPRASESREQQEQNGGQKE